MSPLLLSAVFLTWLQLSDSSTPGYHPRFASASSSAPAPAPSREDDSSKLKIGYWPSYSSQAFPVGSLNASFYTHLNFAFASVNTETFQVEIPMSSQLSALRFSSSVRKQNPDVKTLLSIGGGGSNETVFSQMARSSVSRQAFIESSIRLAKLYRFDGIDVDWEFPRSVRDMNNLGLLFSEMQAALSASSRPLLLTAAVYYSPAVPDNLLGMRYRYPVESMVASLAWVNIMCYDYHGTWDPTKTGQHTALDDPNSNLSSSYGIQRWLEEGLPPSKAVMGLAMYGRTWLLANLSDTGIGAAAKGPGPRQNLSGELGIIFYVEVDELVRTRNVTVMNDVNTGSAYCFLDDFWIGYDDQLSIERKVEYLLSQEMRGYFFWTASFDSNSQLAVAASRTLDTGRAPTPVPPVPPVPPVTLNPPMQSGTRELIQLSSYALIIFWIALVSV